MPPTSWMQATNIFPDIAPIRSGDDVVRSPGTSAVGPAKTDFSAGKGVVGTPVTSCGTLNQISSCFSEPTQPEPAVCKSVSA